MRPQSPEEKLVHDLTLAIARGTYITGELLPEEITFAHALLIAPNRVTWAYQRLAERGLVLDFGEHRTMVVKDAATQAKRCLLEMFETQLAASIAELESARCGAEEIQSVLGAVIARLRKSGRDE